MKYTTPLSKHIVPAISVIKPTVCVKKIERNQKIDIHLILPYKYRFTLLKMLTLHDHPNHSNSKCGSNTLHINHYHPIT